MRKPDTITIDLWHVVMLSTALILGIKGMVSWWVILLIFLSKGGIKLKYNTDSFLSYFRYYFYGVKRFFYGVMKPFRKKEFIE